MESRNNRLARNSDKKDQKGAVKQKSATPSNLLSKEQHEKAEIEKLLKLRDELLKQNESLKQNLNDMALRGSFLDSGSELGATDSYMSETSHEIRQIRNNYDMLKPDRASDSIQDDSLRQLPNLNRYDSRLSEAEVFQKKFELKQNLMESIDQISRGNRHLQRMTTQSRMNAKSRLTDGKYDSVEPSLDGLNFIEKAERPTFKEQESFKTETSAPEIISSDEDSS